MESGLVYDLNFSVSEFCADYPMYESLERDVWRRRL